MPTLTLGTNTYVELAEAEAYFATYPNDSWSGEDDAKEQALIYATQSIDLLYGKKYLGILQSDSQPLLFPRGTFADQNGRTVSGIPASLKNAVCEIAVMSLDGTDILPQPATGNNVRSDSLTVGGISISTENFKPATGESYDGFNKVDIHIRPLLRTPAANWRIGR